MAKFARIQLKITRSTKLTGKLDHLPIAVQNAIEAAQIRNAEDLEKTARSLIRSGGSKALRMERKLRRSSLPGEPPMRQSGRLERSIFGTVIERFTAALVAGGFMAPYIRLLEFGRKNARPRPFMYRAAKIVHKRAVGRISKGIREAVKAVART